MKDNRTLWIVGGITIFLLFMAMSDVNVVEEIKEKINQISGGGSSANSQGNDFISFKFYDANHNEVKLNKQLFAIVSGTPGIKYSQVTLTVTNTGSYALSCIPTSISPPAWNSALSKTEKQILVGNKMAWTSSDIDLDTLATTTGPVRFSATVNCTYNNGASVVTMPGKTGYIDVTIQPDSTGASYDVSVDLGGAPTEYCGDGSCQATETTSTCPADCAVIQNVKFRTTDIGYISGSAIGYTSTCGTALTKYGYASASGSISGDCASQTTLSSYCGTSPVKLFTIPGTGTVLFKPTETDRLCVCKTASTGGSYNILKYTTGDSDASKVDSSMTSFDTAKEVLC